jgi:phosphate transport system protein
MPIELQKELTHVRRLIMAMGAAVEQRVNRAIEALLDWDLEAAREVRTGDREIDQMEVEIESECLRVLALGQPVASDLRFILVVLRLNTDLERIGDLAKSIAKRVINLADAFDVSLPPALTEMCHATRQMFSDALAALANNDAQACRQIRRSDQHVDDLQKEIFYWVQREIPLHIEATQAAIDILSIARKLERIADIATNIAEDVIFLVEGAIVRHTKA